MSATAQLRVAEWSEPITTPQGVTYTPWSNGWSIGYRCEHADGRVEFLYLNASGEDESETGAGSVFVYKGPHGDPGSDKPEHYYEVFEVSDGT